MVDPVGGVPSRSRHACGDFKTPAIADPETSSGTRNANLPDRLGLACFKSSPVATHFFSSFHFASEQGRRNESTDALPPVALPEDAWTRAR